MYTYFQIIKCTSDCALQVAYGILNRFEVEVTKEEAEGVDTLRYNFIKLQAKAVRMYYGLYFLPCAGELLHLLGARGILSTFGNFVAGNESAGVVQFWY